MSLRNFKLIMWCDTGSNVASSVSSSKARTMVVINPPNDMVPFFFTAEQMCAILKGTKFNLLCVRATYKKRNSLPFNLLEFSRPKIVHANKSQNTRMTGLWIYDAKFPSKETMLWPVRFLHSWNASVDQLESTGSS